MLSIFSPLEILDKVIKTLSNLRTKAVFSGERPIGTEGGKSVENNLELARAKNLGARLALFGSTLCIAACGQPSGANANQSATPQSPVSAPEAAASSAAKRASLPIEQGIYGDVEEEGCAGTTRVFFYDGSNYGLVHQADQEGAGRASAKVYPIERVGSFAPGDMVPPDNLRNFEGFAKVWSPELGSPDEYGDVEIEFVGIKATGSGRFVRRLGGHGMATGKFGRFDETYQKCNFSELSPQMQATIRAVRPQLAGETTASAAPASGAPPPRGFSAAGQGRLPVKTGLWADDRAGSCTAMKANDPAFILADDRMLFVQDSMNLTPVKDLGGARFQTGSRDNGDLQILHILSPTRMKIQGGLEGSYSWCSANTRWEPWEFDPTE